MRITGIGTDIVYIPRVASLLGKYGPIRVMQRIFTVKEQLYFANLRHLVNEKSFINSLAGRIAGKEAIFKAASTMHFKPGWRSIDIEKLNDGRLNASMKLEKGHDDEYNEKIKLLLSISHDGDYATAFAMSLTNY